MQLRAAKAAGAKPAASADGLNQIITAQERAAIVTDNTAQARKKLDGQRSAVRDASRKWHRYTEAHEKETQWKTIQNAQGHIAKLKRDHPTLNSQDAADTWKPGDRAL